MSDISFDPETIAHANRKAVVAIWGSNAARYIRYPKGHDEFTGDYLWEEIDLQLCTPEAVVRFVEEEHHVAYIFERAYPLCKVASLLNAGKYDEAVLWKLKHGGNV